MSHRSLIHAAARAAFHRPRSAATRRPQSSCSSRPPPPPRDGAGDLLPAGGAARGAPLPPGLQQTISAHPVVAFTRSWCSFCKDMVERLDDAGVPFHEAQLEGDGDRDALRAHTGQRSVPFVFIKGSLVDPDAFAGALRAPGDKAVATLAQHGVALGKGYFRP